MDTRAIVPQRRTRALPHPPPLTSSSASSAHAPTDDPCPHVGRSRPRPPTVPVHRRITTATRSRPHDLRTVCLSRHFVEALAAHNRLLWKDPSPARHTSVRLISWVGMEGCIPVGFANNDPTARALHCATAPGGRIVPGSSCVPSGTVL